VFKERTDKRGVKANKVLGINGRKRAAKKVDHSNSLFGGVMAHEGGRKIGGNPNAQIFMLVHGWNGMKSRLCGEGESNTGGLYEGDVFRFTWVKR
jgi:hypothetical protein